LNTFFVLRHIIRTKAKSALAAAVAFSFILILSFLHGHITHVEYELDYMYESFVVRAEIRPGATIPPDRNFGDVIRWQTVDEILKSEFTKDELVQTVFRFAAISPLDEANSHWDDCIEYWLDWYTAVLDESGQIVQGTSVMVDANTSIGLVGFNDVDLFLAERAVGTAGHLIGNWEGRGGVDEDAACFETTQAKDELHIVFKPEFDESQFMHVAGEPIPVILSVPVMEMRGLVLGDLTYLCTMDDAIFTHSLALVVGTHNSVNLPFDPAFRDAVLMPAEATRVIFHQLIGHELGFISLSFDINPLWNRNLFKISEKLHEILRHSEAGFAPLTLVMRDEELRIVVGSMEQNLSLLRLLYPVAIVVSAAIGLGLSLLMILQNAKNAALLRTLGVTKARTRAMLLSVQMGVCLVGIAIGLAAVSIAGWGIEASAMPAGLYLSGSAAGSAIGAILLTNRSPLALLQVKE